MSDKNGGPAFPTQTVVYENGQVQYGDNGMTLRDYFAAKAMAAMWSNQYVIEGLSRITEDQAKAISKMAFEQADAMLAERAK